MTDSYRGQLQEYLREQFPAVEGLTIVEMSLMARGASNETYRLRLQFGGGEPSLAEHYVLRPQRTTGILEPYDISRQYRVMAALQGSDVPVPRLLCLEQTGRVLGTPFFLMEYLEAGPPPLLWQAGDRDARMDAHARTLHGIHQLDWRSRDLAFLGEPTDARDAIGCEIDAWLSRASLPGHEVDPWVGHLAAWLRRHNAGGGDACLVHGDPNPGNYLFRGEEVVGVIDWEVAAISDPRSDLGFYAGLQSLFGGFLGGVPDSAFVPAYEKAAGAKVADLDYFEALGLFKMATIVLRTRSQWEAFPPYVEQALRQRIEEICGSLPPG